MKNALIAFFLSVAACSAEMWTNVLTGETSAWPPRRPADAVNARPEWYVEDGWQRFSPAQQADYDAWAAADAESARTNAEYQATLPVQEPRGFEVPYVVFLDSTNRQKGVAMELTEAGDQVFYVFHASPVDWALVGSNRAAAHAQLAARKEAVEGVKRKGASANSVSALREAFSNLCVEINRPWIIPGR